LFRSMAPEFSIIETIQWSINRRTR